MNNENNEMPIEIYKKVLNRQLKVFPKHFWKKDDALLKSAEITKYLIEDILKWTDDDIKNKFNIYIFRNNKLGGMMSIFNGSPFCALNNAYPNKFKPWELKKSQIQDGYWNDKTIIEATKWLFKKKLKWSYNEIEKCCNVQIFKDYNLDGMLNRHFHDSPYLLLNKVYPNRNWNNLKSKYK